MGFFFFFGGGGGGGGLITKGSVKYPLPVNVFWRRCKLDIPVLDSKFPIHARILGIVCSFAVGTEIHMNSAINSINFI